MVGTEKHNTNDDVELSAEDYELTTTIVLGWFFLWNLLMKLTPEDFAEKVFLKIGKSNKKPAIIRLLFDLIGEKSNFMKSPDEFNQKARKRNVRQEHKRFSPEHKIPQHGEQEYIQHYLNSRRMSEILQYLKDRHILKHIPSKGRHSERNVSFARKSEKGFI